MKTVEKKDDKILITFGGTDFKSCLTFVKYKKLRWDPVAKHWWSNDLRLYDEFITLGYDDPHAIQVPQEVYKPTAIVSVDYKNTPVMAKYIPKEMRPYQLDAVKFMLSHDKAILGLPPGAGKTMVAAVYSAHNQSDEGYTIILCPASLKVHWERELSKWGGIDSEIIEGVTPYAIYPLRNTLIINYDILGRKDPELNRKYKAAVKEVREYNTKVQEDNERNKTNKPLRPVPRDNVPITGWANHLTGKVNMVIADESHYLGDFNSIRVKQFMLLVNRAKYVQCLSGSPIRNRPATFWAQIRTCDPIAFPSQMHFLRRYCNPSIGFRGSVVYNGSSNEEELHDKIKHFVYYRSKEEILPDLPTKNYMIQRVDGDSDFSKQDREIERLIAQGNMSRVEQLSKLRDLIRSAYALKRQYIFDLVDELLDDGEKIVLVCYHEAVILDLANKYDCPYINGSVASNKRQAIIDDYESGKHKVIVLQIQAGGVGFSILTSRTMIFAEAWFIHSEVDQVCARIHRLTSKWPSVDYFMPVVADSIEESMMEAVRDRSSGASVILTGVAKSIFDPHPCKDERLTPTAYTLNTNP